MYDIFISYASDDRERARLLAEALSGQGWTVWWDRSILPGSTYEQVIEKELESAHCVIVLWTTHSVKSHWVRDEASVAATREVLVPVLFEDVKIPLGYRQFQTADFANWDGKISQDCFVLLHSAVQRLAGRPNIPQAPIQKQAPIVDLASRQKHTKLPSEPEQAQIGDNAPKSQKSAADSSAWQVKLTSKGVHQRVFKVVLTQEIHIVEFKFTAWKDSVSVDGEVVSKGWGLDENYDFHLSDGAKRYPARISCDTKLTGHNFFRFEIDGEVVHEEK